MSQESLNILEPMGNRLKDAVRAWLDALPADEG
jgi:hypothetical protein